MAAEGSGGRKVFLEATKDSLEEDHAAAELGTDDVSRSDDDEGAGALGSVAPILGQTREI